MIDVSLTDLYTVYVTDVQQHSSAELQPQRVQSDGEQAVWVYKSTNQGQEEHVAAQFHSKLQNISLLPNVVYNHNTVQYALCVNTLCESKHSTGCFRASCNKNIVIYLLCLKDNFRILQRRLYFPMLFCQRDNLRQNILKLDQYSQSAEQLPLNCMSTKSK